MKRKLMLVFITVFFSLALISCAGVQKQVGLWDDEMMANTMSWSKQIMKHWLANSKVIHGELDTLMETKFPVEFKKALERLDVLGASYATEDQRAKMGEVDAAEIADLFWLKFLGSASVQLINQYAPKVLGAVAQWIPFKLPIL